MDVGLLSKNHYNTEYFSLRYIKFSLYINRVINVYNIVRYFIRYIAIIQRLLYICRQILRNRGKSPF